jgi:two-component system nitrogen regulation response regulator GlnG
LAHYFLFRFDRELGLDVRAIAAESLDLLHSYSWPGNVRELQSALKQAMLNTTGAVLGPDTLPQEIRQQDVKPPTPSSMADTPLQPLIERCLQAAPGNAYEAVISDVERHLFVRALQETHGNLTRAAELRGVNRATLRAKRRTMGLTIDKVVAEEPES